MRKRRRQGNVILIVAAGAMVFIGLLALVIDVGAWYDSRSRLQTSADLAVLAALGGVDPAQTHDAQERSIRSACRRVLTANGVSLEGLELTLTHRSPTIELRLRLSEELERHFSTSFVDRLSVVVEARAHRDREGRIALVP